MIEFMFAHNNTAALWTPQEIREESPEDAHRIKDDHMGISVHSGDNDGALVIGHKDELIGYFERIVNHLKKQ